MRFVFGLILYFVSVTAFSQQGSYVNTVVIDAGHGGKDPGALGRNSKEKDIALSIALKTGAYIEKYLDDVKVIYTRSSDKFIELHKRAQIANSNNADMFISIHCNANRSSQPYGAETYVMGLHKTDANLEVAKAENAAILLEENYREEYDGFDPNSDEGYISLSLLQNEHLEQSITIADLIQKQFRERVGRRDRSVRQAGFLVLYRTTMPGILVETGFLSNPKEERFLLSEKGQTYIASAIYRAFKEYKAKMEAGLPEESLVNLHAENNKKKPDEKQNKSDDLVFGVQIITSPTRKEINHQTFSDPQRTWEYFHQGRYKYIYGKTTSIDEARQLQRKMRKKGYEGAFVVAFNNKERISIQKALELLGKK